MEHGSWEEYPVMNLVSRTLKSSPALDLRSASARAAATVSSLGNVTECEGWSNSSFRMFKHAHNRQRADEDGARSVSMHCDIYCNAYLAHSLCSYSERSVFKFSMPRTWLCCGESPCWPPLALTCALPWCKGHKKTWYSGHVPCNRTCHRITSSLCTRMFKNPVSCLLHLSPGTNCF